MECHCFSRCDFSVPSSLPPSSLLVNHVLLHTHTYGLGKSDFTERDREEKKDERALYRVVHDRMSAMQCNEVVMLYGRAMQCEFCNALLENELSIQNEKCIYDP